MSRRAKKHVGNAVRAAICIAAVWLVARGVTYYDRVLLIDGTEVVGTVLAELGTTGLAVRLKEAPLTGVDVGGGPAAEGVVVIPPERIANDADGAYRISYGLRTAWTASNKLLLLIALLVHFPVVFPQALRFQWLLGAQGIAVSYWECLKLSFAGNFLNFATPLGSHAGDAFKAYFVSLHTDRRTEAVATVVLDRIIGLSTVLVVTAAIITVFTSGQGKLAVLRPYVLGLLAVGFVGAVVYFTLLRRWSVPEAWIARIPALAHVRRLDLAARTLAAHPGLIVSAVLLTVFLQFLALGAYFIVALAINLRADLADFFECFAYFYAGTLVQALPGPPQGLGTVELTYRYFFAAYGSPSQIVCMALAIRVVVLTCALPGLLVTLTGGYRPKAAELEQQLPAADSATAATQDPSSPVAVLRSGRGQSF